MSEDLPREDDEVQPQDFETDQLEESQEKETDIPKETTSRLDEDVERIPWGEYIKSQFRKILGVIILLVIFFFIITLSSEISEAEVLRVNSLNYIILMIFSSILFLSVLGIFTKVVLLDHKKEFGIEEWKSPQGIITFLLTTSFISLVYILLDVSLVNIYIMTFPAYVVWYAPSIIPSLGPYIPEGIDRIAYSTIRSYFFIVLLGFIFIFPLVMFVNILTRIGRSQIKKRREKDVKIKTKKLILPFLLLPVGLGIILLITLQIQVEILRIFFIFILMVGGVVWLVIALLLLFTLVRFTVFVTWSNFLLIFPFIFLFYILPGLLWGLWDLFVISSLGTTENTIYERFIDSSFSIDPNNTIVAELAPFDILRFYLQTVFLNLGGIIRILQLDFIFIIGLSAIAIGFAEGFSIFAILRSISTGVSIAKTGRVARESAPKMIVISTRLVYLMAWLGYFWDKMIVIAKSLSDSININLPMVKLPRLLSIVIDLGLSVTSINDQLLIFTVLIVPFYFIISSAFKFLSVSIALERLQKDRSGYYLLISSAYILIVTNILAEIIALPAFQTDQRQYLPLSGLAIELLPFITKIFEFLEAMAFYAGFLFSIGYLTKRYLDEREK